MEELNKQRGTKIDDIDELLKLQSEFLNKNEKPLSSVQRKGERIKVPEVKAINKGGEVKEEGTEHKGISLQDVKIDRRNLSFTNPNFEPSKPKPTKKPSLFAQRRKEARRKGLEGSGSVHPSLVVNNEDQDVEILKEVVEKDISEIKIDPDLVELKNKGKQENGFPEVLMEQAFLDAYQVENEFRGGLGKISGEEEEEGSDSLMRYIGQENDKKIMEMSEEEILESRRKLMEELDPELIAALMRNSKNSQPEMENVLSIPQDKKALVSSLKSRTKLKNESLLPTDSQTLSEEKRVRFDTTTKEELDIMKETYFQDVATEPEKLEWMLSDIPGQATSTKIDRIRFDFDGGIVGKDDDIPSHAGLHHHGKDPDQPGYNLDELVLLTRSTVAGQRTIALNIIAKIFQNIRHGSFSLSLPLDIMRFLSKSDLALHVRMCLDDSISTVIVAAINVLHSWICGLRYNTTLGDDSEPEERLWSNYSQVYKGYEIFTIGSLIDSDPNIVPMNPGEDDGSQTYHRKLSTHDTLLGLVAMQILDRIRFLMDKFPLPHSSQNLLLDILLRLARHSFDLAQTIAQTPSLLEVIVKRYLDISWPIDLEYKQTEASFSPIGYKSPIPSVIAIRLLKVLCQADKSIAQQLISTNKLQPCLRFLLVEVNEPEELKTLALNLQTEVFRLFHIISIYNLEIAPLRDLHNCFATYAFSLRSLLTLTLDPQNPTKICTLNSGHQLIPPCDSSVRISQAYISKATTFFRFLESLVNSSFAIDRADLQQKWTLIRDFLNQACSIFSSLGQALSQPNNIELNFLYSALLDFIFACSTLIQSGLIEDKESLEVIDGMLRSNNLLFLFDATLTLLLKSTAKGQMIEPIFAKSETWSHHFLRVFPALSTANHIRFIEELYAHSIPNIGLIRSLSELIKLYAMSFEDYFFKIQPLILNLIQLTAHIPTELAIFLRPIYHLTFSILQQPCSWKKLPGSNVGLVWLFNHAPESDGFKPLIIEKLINDLIIPSQEDGFKIEKEKLITFYHDYLNKTDDSSSQYAPGVMFDRFPAPIVDPILFTLQPLNSLFPLKVTSDGAEDFGEFQDLSEVLGCIQLTIEIYASYRDILCEQKTDANLGETMNLVGDTFQLLKLIFLPGTMAINPQLVKMLDQLNKAIGCIDNIQNSSLSIQSPLAIDAPKFSDGIIAARHDLYKESITRYLSNCFYHSAYLTSLFAPLNMNPAKFPSDFRVTLWAELIMQLPKSLLTSVPHFFNLSADNIDTSNLPLLVQHVNPVESSFSVLDLIAKAIFSHRIDQSSGYLYNLAVYHLRSGLNLNNDNQLSTLPDDLKPLAVAVKAALEKFGFKI